jgi:hypothetical protein
MRMRAPTVMSLALACVFSMPSNAVPDQQTSNYGGGFDDPDHVGGDLDAYSKTRSSSPTRPGSPVYGPKSVQVYGYTRKDGTYVAPYSRAAPGTGKKKGGVQ